MLSHMRNERRQAAWDQTAGRCFYCGIPFAPDKAKSAKRDWLVPQTNGMMGIDHRFPTQRGGSDKPDNHAPCCSSCNSSKGLKTPPEFRFWRKLTSGDFNFRFFGDPPSCDRDYVIVISESFKRGLMRYNFPAARK